MCPFVHAIGYDQAIFAVSRIPPSDVLENPLDLIRCPFPSRRSSVLSANGVVATSQPLAAQAGLSMLQNGGNAVDAALATAMALTVLEPTSNGIGSDAFALIWDGKQLHGLNASGRWPAAYSAQAMRDAGHDEMPQIGWSTVTVPGAVSMWGDLSERFGSMDAAQLLAPAIGFAVVDKLVPIEVANVAVFTCANKANWHN